MADVRIDPESEFVRDVKRQNELLERTAQGVARMSDGESGEEGAAVEPGAGGSFMGEDGGIDVGFEGSGFFENMQRQNELLRGVQTTFEEDAGQEPEAFMDQLNPAIQSLESLVEMGEGEDDVNQARLSQSRRQLEQMRQLRDQMEESLGEEGTLGLDEQGVQELSNKLTGIRKNLKLTETDETLGEVFRERLNVAASQIKEGFNVAVEGIKSGFESAMGVLTGDQSLTGAIGSGFSMIAPLLGSTIAGAIASWFGFGSLSAAVSAALSSAFSGLTAMGFVTSILGLGGFALGGGVLMDLFFGGGQTAGLVGELLDAVGVTSVVNMIFGTDVDLGEMFARRFAAGAQGLHAAFNQLILDPMSSMLDGLMNPIDTLQGGFGMLSDATEWVSQSLFSVGEDIGSFFASAIPNVANQISNAMTLGLRSTLSAFGFDGLASSLRNLPTKIGNFILQLPQKIVTAFTNNIPFFGGEGGAQQAGQAAESMTGSSAVGEVVEGAGQAVGAGSSLVQGDFPGAASQAAGAATTPFEAAAGLAGDAGSVLGLRSSGVVTEPSIAFTKSGQPFTLAEDQPEAVGPVADIEDGGSGPTMSESGATTVQASGGSDASQLRPDLQEQTGILQQMNKALQELVGQGGKGGQFNLRDVPSGEDDTLSLLLAKGAI